MSAYLVDRKHIDALAQAMNSARPCVEIHTATGRLLWLENLASVKARYPRDTSGNRPGPVGLTDEEIAGYEWAIYWPTLSPVQVLKMVNCYEYQSCEHDGWAKSKARSLCRRLRCHAISLLPGYDEAVWGAPPNTAGEGFPNAPLACL